MKRLGILVLCAAFAAVILGGALSTSARPGAKADARSAETKILLLVCNQYGANYNLIRDVMEIYGWDVATAGVTPTVTQCYYGGPITVDMLVADITDVSQFDCLAIMPARAVGGNSHIQLLESPEALALVSQAVAEGLLVAAFCGGTRVLAAADVINGVHVTGHSLYVQEYEDAGAIFVGNPVPPVLDGNILTCVRNQTNAERVCEIMRNAIEDLGAARKNK